MSDPAFPNDSTNPLHSGMTLRDYFAAAAMKSLISCEGLRELPESSLSREAYQYADAMLAQRNKK